jgi:hypothetical protein
MLQSVSRPLARRTPWRSPAAADQRDDAVLDHVDSGDVQALTGVLVDRPVVHDQLEDSARSDSGALDPAGAQRDMRVLPEIRTGSLEELSRMSGTVGEQAVHALDPAVAPLSITNVWRR